MLGGEDAGFSYLWPALVSAAVWPLFSALLDNINRKLG
jgi:rod shape-determining protein MreD